MWVQSAPAPPEPHLLQGAATAHMWICPICTLHSGEPMWLNDVPYRHGQPEDFKNQATAHVEGKRHETRRQKVANELFQGSGCARFFAIIGHSIPNSMQISQAAALKEYTEECGGNGDKTISKLEPLPGPDPMPPPMVVCKRDIISPDYATKVLAPQHIMRTQLLCCWDDPRGTAQCTRGLCPYRHTKAKLETLPPEQQCDLATCMRSFHATSRACPGGADFTKHASKGRTGTCQFSKLNKATTKSASRWLQVLSSRMSSMQGMKLWNISQYMMAICGTSTSAALVTQARHRCSGNRLLKSMSGKSRDLRGAFLMVVMTLNSGPYIWLMWLSIHEPYKTVLWQGQTIAVGSSLGRALCFDS